MSGARPESFAASGACEVDAGDVTEADIARALAACQTPPREEGREILHAMPVNYTLDGATGLTDPRGLVGRQLSIDLHLVTVASAPFRNLALCVKRNDLELAGVVSAPHAAGLSSLVEDEQELGAACVDLGGGATSISIFLRKQMIYADVVRLGGEHVTLDIARGLSMSAAEAERLKTLHGGVIATESDDREFVEAPQIGEDPAGDRRRIARSALIGVIRPRIEEIFEEVRDRLNNAGFSHLPGRQVVLTGGGCQLPSVVEAAQRILGRRVRAGRPLRIAGLPHSASGPGFATAVGLAAYLVAPADELWDFETAESFSPRTRLHRAVRWFCDNW
jgi:cell division protein FtsA